MRSPLVIILGLALVPIIGFSALAKETVFNFSKCVQSLESPESPGAKQIEREIALESCYQKCKAAIVDLPTCLQLKQGVASPPSRRVHNETQNESQVEVQGGGGPQEFGECVGRQLFTLGDITSQQAVRICEELCCRKGDGKDADATTNLLRCSKQREKYLTFYGINFKDYDDRPLFGGSGDGSGGGRTEHPSPVSCGDDHNQDRSWSGSCDNASNDLKDQIECVIKKTLND